MEYLQLKQIEEQDQGTAFGKLEILNYQMEFQLKLGSRQNLEYSQAFTNRLDRKWLYSDKLTKQSSQWTHALEGKDRVTRVKDGWEMYSFYPRLAIQVKVRTKSRPKKKAPPARGPNGDWEIFRQCMRHDPIHNAASPLWNMCRRAMRSFRARHPRSWRRMTHQGKYEESLENWARAYIVWGVRTDQVACTWSLRAARRGLSRSSPRIHASREPGSFL